MIPLHFRAYHDDVKTRRKDDEPHGILKVLSSYPFWYQSPGGCDYYPLNFQATSLIEKQQDITFHPSSHIKLVKISKSEYDTDIAFDLFPEYTVRYRPMRVRFDKLWLRILVTIFFIHLAIILLAIAMMAAANSSTDGITQQAFMAMGSWVSFSAAALCCWLVDSLSYWRKIRRGLTDPS